MNILYSDKRISVVIKPAGVVSVDEPGGVPDLARAALGGQCMRTVHRLDRPVGGVMVLARSRYAAAELSRQVENREFEKEYLAVVTGAPGEKSGRMDDILYRDKTLRKTLVVDEASRESRPASLLYETVASQNGLSLLRITLLTGRTHQIRAQLSSRGLPIVGDKKYGSPVGSDGIALWSRMISFTHPESGERMRFEAEPPEEYPWNAVE